MLLPPGQTHTGPHTRWDITATAAAAKAAKSLVGCTAETIAQAESTNKNTLGKTKF